MLLFWRPRIKDVGAMFSTFNVPLATVTANVTNTYGIGGISDKDIAAPNSAHTAFVDEVHVGFVTVPADADGTTVLSIFKYDASADEAVTLVTDFDLEGLTDGMTGVVAIDAAATDQQRMVDFGDFLYATIVNDSAAFTTDPVGGALTVLTKFII